MKITLQISKDSLKKLEEVYDGELYFCVEESYYGSVPLRTVEVVNEAYYPDPKKEKAKKKLLEKQQKQLKKSKISDFLIKVKKINQVKYRVLKIEPDELKKY